MKILGDTVALIGDPHLGKTFEVGVPLARRGEREALQFDQFVKELSQPAQRVIIMGDLFDHPYVSYAVVKKTADALLCAAAYRPETTFHVLAGNHDMPRNITAIGAFDVLKGMIDGRYDNLWSVTVPIIAYGIAMFPWEWHTTALNQLPQEPWSDVHAIVGHWDLKSFGGSDSHLAPVAELRRIFGDAPIYSGHYHVAGDYPVGGGTVHCTGSMQPYAHDQDPSGELYVTLDRQGVLDQGDALRDKVVRVRLRPGEDLPAINCLALTHERLAPVVDEGASFSEPLAKVFDWQKTLASKLKPLDPVVQSYITERLPAGEQRADSD